VNTLYGLGIGPGAPDLLTLRAARILMTVPVVVGPRPRRGDDSLAARIAAPHLGPSSRLEEIVFPMLRDRDALREAWDAAACSVLEWLDEGDVAFLTLGDASLYSTWTYLRAAVLRRRPDQRVETVPGITSFAAAAARAERPLAEGDQALVVVPWAADRDRPWLEGALEAGEGAAFLKVADRLEGMDALLRRAGRTDSVLARRVELEGQEIRTDWQDHPARDTGYLAVVLSGAGGAP